MFWCRLLLWVLLGDIMNSPSRFEPGASHQSGADEILKRSDSRNTVFVCPSPIKSSEPSSALSLVHLQSPQAMSPVVCMYLFYKCRVTIFMYSRFATAALRHPTAQVSGLQLAKEGECRAETRNNGVTSEKMMALVTGIPSITRDQIAKPSLGQG